MADNVNAPGTGEPFATRSVIYSGDVVHAPATGLVTFAGSDDAKTASDISDANPLPVAFPAAATATLSNVSGSASSVTLQAANASRKGLVIINDSTAILYVKFGSTASATSYTYQLNGSAVGIATLELPLPIYTGIVTGIWVSATGAARMTELT